MEYVPFLNSSGAIITNPDGVRSNYAELVPVVPHTEPVQKMEIEVDSSALYGDHPENLARFVYTSGAALVFYCDSVAGGSDTSGEGTLANPWRSLHAASRFLECNACFLNAAADRIVLYVKGTVDYAVPHAGVNWFAPFFDYGRGSRLIISGWDEQYRTNLTSGRYQAGQFVDLELSDPTGPADGFIAYHCTVYGGLRTNDRGRYAYCFIEQASASDPFGGQVFYNCSCRTLASAPIVYGGSYFLSSGGASVNGDGVINGHYMYAVSAICYQGDDYDSALALAVGYAAVSCDAEAYADGSRQLARAVTAYGHAVYLKDCNMTAEARGRGATAQGVSGALSATVTIEGGAITASAYDWIYSPGNAAATAAAANYDWSPPVFQVSGVTVNLYASAATSPIGIDSSAQWTSRTETERVYDFTGSCITSRKWEYYYGELHSSSATSSGSLCP